MKAKASKYISDESWKNTLNCFGTSYIMKRKFDLLSFWNQSIKFLGFLMPVLVGGLILSFGTAWAYASVVIVVVSVVGIAQLTISLWALNDNWDGKLNDFYESMNDHDELSSQFEEISRLILTDYKKYEVFYEKIQLKLFTRTKADNRLGISDKEKRIGMRYTLRNYQKQCAKCGNVPYDMKATDCPVCGKF